jgi:SAM-dependent methyltransferase
MTDLLERSREYWDKHAERDPLWAILSEADKKDGRWDVRRFFRTGENEIRALFYQLRIFGIAVNRRSVLDFGCGVGRLTQALAPLFVRAVGIDISPKMIDWAKRLNRFPDRVSYVRNAAPDLAVLGPLGFDFIISAIVLQHIEPPIALGYVREFLRLLAPGGVLVFQVPSHQAGPDERLSDSASGAMPDDAYQASIRAVGVPPGPLRPGAEVVLDLDITNTSGVEWSRADWGVMRIGNHWLDGAGLILVRDDGRADIPGRVLPGETFRSTLTIKAPREDGEYLCEIDLVHEGVVWFRDKGSRALRLPVSVRAARAVGGDPIVADAAPVEAPASDRRESGAGFIAEPDTEIPELACADLTAEPPGDFPMFGIPVETVAETIARAGAKLLRTEPDRSCGREWISYRYFVRK